jgi:hypothetical protein
MMIFDEQRPFLFVKLEPLVWVGWLRRIVAVQGVTSRDG